MIISIRNERPFDGPAIERLLDFAFEPERHARPSYRLREGVARRDDLCFVADSDRTILGVIRFWPILVGGRAAVLLGPIAVHPDHEGHGIGTALVRNGLDASIDADFSIVVAIGAQAFLGRFGFRRASPLGLSFPAKVDDERFLVHELAPNALSGNAGWIAPARETAPLGVAV